MFPTIANHFSGNSAGLFRKPDESIRMQLNGLSKKIESHHDWDTGTLCPYI